MKTSNESGNIYDYQIFVCNCEDISHQLVVSSPKQVEVEVEKEIIFSFHLNPERTFFERIKEAVKYIFGKRSNYGAFDTVMLSLPKMKSLKDILEKEIERFENIKLER